MLECMDYKVSEVLTGGVFSWVYSPADKAIPRPSSPDRKAPGLIITGACFSLLVLLE